MNDEWDSWGDGLALMEAYIHDAAAELEKIDRKALVKYRRSLTRNFPVHANEKDLRLEELNDRQANLKTLLAHAQWAMKAAQEGRVSEAIFASHSVRAHKYAVNWPRDEQFVRNKVATERRRAGGYTRAQQLKEDAEARRSEVRLKADRLRRAGTSRDEWTVIIHGQTGIPLRTVQRDLQDYERAIR